MKVKQLVLLLSVIISVSCSASTSSISDTKIIDSKNSDVDASLPRAKLAYSDYTSLKGQDCTIIESRPDEGGYYRETCPSKSPDYQLELERLDLRNGLNVVYNGDANHNDDSHDDSKDKSGKNSKHNIGYWYSQSFYIGDTVEWRYRKTEGQQKDYHALIYRIYSADYSEQGELPDKQELFVIRLNKQHSCILDKVPQSKDMNIKAREIADDMSLPCSAELNQGWRD